MCLVCFRAECAVLRGMNCLACVLPRFGEMLFVACLVDGAACDPALCDGRVVGSGDVGLKSSDLARSGRVFVTSVGV
jgi:hypothetical protein